MNNVYVLTPDFKLEGIIDEYVSIIWRPSYSEVGDFEIYLGATDKAINLLQENRYVVRSSDITVENVTKENTATIPTENGLAGIKVSSGGNYTDQNGQQWICDEVVKYADGSGAYIQRVAKKVYKGTAEEPWRLDTTVTSMNRYAIRVADSKYTTVREYALCSHGTFINSGHADGVVFIYNRDFYFYKPDAESIGAFKTWLSENNITVCYELAEPITTPLTAEEIAEIEKVSTFYSVTNLSNDSGCDMSVTYLSNGAEKTVSGKNIYSTDLGNSKIISFSLYGNSIQNGTPNPANPIKINVAGEKGNIVVKNVGQGSMTTYEKVMVIKNIKLITDIENGDFLCVTGRELKFLLHQRIVWSQTTLTGSAENSIRRLVNENAITPTDTKRVIPNLALGVSAGLTDTIEKQITGEYLDNAVTEICTTYNYGWDIFITNNTLVFVVYAGSDRSYEQTDRPYVVFSDEFENLYNTDYQLFTEEYANTTLIGGEGEGLERVFTTVNNQLSGLDRYETFTDARDISSNKGTEDEIDATTYLKLLVERGRENLATLSYTEGFSGEVLSDVAFKYGQDFFIGDTVTVINKYGIQKNVRVLSAIESEDEAGVKLLPQFNI